MADLYKEAKQCLEDGDLETAVKKTEEALAKFKSSGDADGMMDVVKTLVAAHIAVGKLEDAKLAVKDVLAQFKTSGNKAGQAAMLLATGELSCSDKDAEKALSLVPEIKALIPGAGGKSNELEMAMLNLQVTANLLKGASSDAMNSAREMRALAQKNSDKEGEANAWHAIASVYHMQETDDTDRSTPEDAVQAAEKAVSLYKDVGSKNSEATAMNTVAKAQLRMEKISQGLKTATDALAIFRDLKSTRGMVKSLEVIVQAHIYQDNPAAGLAAANKELAAVKTSGNKRGEVDLLEMIAQAHASLNQPYSALKAAGQAMEIFAGLGDNMGQGSMYLVMADMQRASGGMGDALSEATKYAEKALKCFRAAGSKWGEEDALQTISSLLVDRGQPEKAPKRGEAQKALKELQKAIEMRKTDDIKSVEDKLNKLGNLVSDADIQGILSPVLLKDPSALEFLEEQGWQFKKEGAMGGGATKIKQYPHKGFYLHMIMTGMNFGPQFRVVNPYRVGTPGQADCTCVTVSQLPETEAWQMEMGYRPGMLDSGLQCQAMLAFP